MAAQKKKSSKKSTKSKNDLKNEKDSSLWGMVFGWFLLLFGTVLLLGCISSVYSGNDGNWLGPFFGNILPNLATGVFGRLPVIFFTLTLVLWGVFVTFENLRARVLSFAVGMLLLTLDLSCLMSLKAYGGTGLSMSELSMNGGVLGQFFMQNVFVSVFGKASAFAPLVILVALLGLILVLSFGLRPRHLAFIAKACKWLTSLFLKKKPDGELKSREEDLHKVESSPSDLRRSDMLIDDSTIYSVPDGYNIRDKGGLKPFKVKRNMIPLASETDVVPPVNFEKGLSENPYALENTVVGNFGECAEGIPESEIPNVPESVTDYNGEDPEILRLEQELRENEHRMSALQIKEIKDRIAAVRRARDVLNWEKAHQNRLVVKGAVRGTESEMEKIQDDAATVVASASAEICEPENEAARTFVSDENGGGAPLDETLPKPEDEDTFIPEIVGMEDVNRDPTYVPPNKIGTSEGRGVPQPDPTAHFDEYRVPTVDDILDTHEPQPADYTEDELNEIGHMLEEKLENFKVKGKVVGCETGPVITRFEVEPGPGVKVSQFSALQDDLAMALRAVSIRILTPIPGKGAVGIEIPNRKAQIIYGRDIFESEAFKPSPEKIMVALGKDISGEPFTMDLAKAPHLMIAGQTGSGKSVCINALMASMLFSKTPEELRMILVDPKAVELKMYENIPHLLAPVITKPEVAIQALQWLCYEMDRRTEVLASAKVRNLNGFNEKFEAGELPEEVPEEDRNHRMAFIVVVIDEMADLMMVAGKEIEKSVSRLAAKARAVGIHLVLATQRPSVKVITGNIKANLPTRISFKVASQVDARTVMDHAGAEKLLGRGDMLFKAVNAPDPVRVHGAFLSDEEAEKLADACSDQNVCYPQLESFDVEGASEDGEDGENAAMSEKLDKLLFEVAKWAIECGNGLSTSAVQRHFSVGYSRAGKIVDQLYGLGVCGRSTGNSKPRALLVDMEGLMNLERSGKLG